MRFSYLFSILLLLTCVTDAAFPQTPPKGRRTPKRARKVRTRNNRAGRDKEKKQLCAEDLKGTCPGSFSLVYTVTANTRPRHGDNPTDARSLAMAFNVYVTPRVFLELDQDHVLSQRALGQPRVTGRGDTTALMGADVLLEDNQTPGVALLYGVKLPTASAIKGLGSGHSDQQVAVNLHKNLGRKYFEYDAGLILARVPTSDGSRITTLGGGVMSGLTQYNLNRRNLLHFQLDATLPGHGYKGDLSALSFWQTRLNEHLALRLGATTGLTSNTPRAGLYATFVWEDNLRRWRH